MRMLWHRGRRRTGNSCTLTTHSANSCRRLLLLPDWCLVGDRGREFPIVHSSPLGIVYGQLVEQLVGNLRGLKVIVPMDAILPCQVEWRAQDLFECTLVVHRGRAIKVTITCSTRP